MTIIDPKTLAVLLRAAKDASDGAYCPYSCFRVGAAVLSENGTIYKGANIENASFGLTICAERTALFNAWVSGGRNFIAVVVYTATGSPTSSCGACRQVMRELAPEANVFFSCDGPNVRQSSVMELLPDSFGPDSIINN